MGDDYDKKKKSPYITYVDANNLYGQSMTQPLPQEDLKFETCSLESILETPDDAETGYFVEADLEFPEELHDKFKQYPPPMPRKLATQGRMVQRLPARSNEQNAIETNKREANTAFNEARELCLTL